MSTSLISNYFGNQLWQSTLTKNGGYLALHIGDPGVAGDSSTELAGGTYRRQRITFAAPSGKAVVSSNKQTFTGVPANKILFLAVWDSLAGGSMLISIRLDNPISPTDQAHFLCAKGDIGIAL